MGDAEDSIGVRPATTNYPLRPGQTKQVADRADVVLAAVRIARAVSQEIEMQEN